MTAAFIALAALGLAALLVTVWLLVAGERRRVAATCLVGGLVLLIGAGVVAAVAHRNYSECADRITQPLPGELAPLPPPEGWDAALSKCDSKLVLDGALGY